MAAWPHLASPGENVVVSPAGLLALLTSLHAVSDGVTRREIESILFDGGEHWRAPSLELVPELEIRRAIFAPASVDGPHRRITCAGAEFVAFEPSVDPAMAVAAWMERGVNVAPAVTSLPANALVVAATTRFEAAWAERFGPPADVAPFYGPDGTPRQMTYLFGERIARHAQQADAQILALSLATDGADAVEREPGARPEHNQPEDARFELILVMPHDGLDAIERGLDEATLTRWFQELSQGTVYVYLPPFELAGESVNRQMLEALGIESIDHPGIAFDLGGDPHFGALGAVSSLRVDQHGVSAQDASFHTILSRGEVSTLTFDHPFLVFIRDVETGLLVSMGRVVEPMWVEPYSW